MALELKALCMIRGLKGVQDIEHSHSEFKLHLSVWMMLGLCMGLVQHASLSFVNTMCSCMVLRLIRILDHDEILSWSLFNICTIISRD